MRRSARIRLAVLATALGSLALPAAASAHKPIFLDEEARDPATAPVIEDGTVSFAAYGWIDRKGDHRFLRVRHEKGDDVFVELLLPAKDPEQALAAEDLPVVTVLAPNGKKRVLRARERTRFDEPFSRTSYVRLFQWRTTAKVAGEYRLRVTAPRRLRFCLATGLREVFSAEDVVELPGSIARVRAWYRGER